MNVSCGLYSSHGIAPSRHSTLLTSDVTCHKHCVTTVTQRSGPFIGQELNNKYIENARPCWVLICAASHSTGRSEMIKCEDNFLFIYFPQICAINCLKTETLNISNVSLRKYVMLVKICVVVLSLLTLIKFINDVKS